MRRGGPLDGERVTTRSKESTANDGSHSAATDKGMGGHRCRRALPIQGPVVRVRWTRREAPLQADAARRRMGRAAAAAGGRAVELRVRHRGGIENRGDAVLSLQF